MHKFAIGAILSLLASGQEKREQQLPEELQKTYDTLMEAFRMADSEAIKKCALRGAIVITGDERKQNREYGADINLPFLKKGFSGKIEKLIEQDDGTYLIRTATSGLCFVQYRKEWKLFHYGDKPIE